MVELDNDVRQLSKSFSGHSAVINRNLVDRVVLQRSICSYVSIGSEMGPRESVDVHKYTPCEFCSGSMASL